MKNIKKRIINKVADVLSYPTRTLYDAKTSISNAAADKIRKMREIKKARIKRGSYY